MRIRIISGAFGGRMISAPDGKTTHPMSERAKNALFNSLGDLVDGALVLDAFAGTGALGLEALSRGAKQAVFVEKDRIAQAHIAKNIVSLGLEDRGQLVRSPVASWTETYEGELFDLIFADPPYHDPQLSTVSRLFGLLKPGALMVLSHPGKGEVTLHSGIVVVDNRSYGNLNLTFFRLDA